MQEYDEGIFGAFIAFFTADSAFSFSAVGSLGFVVSARVIAFGFQLLAGVVQTAINHHAVAHGNVDLLKRQLFHVRRQKIQFIHLDRLCLAIAFAILAFGVFALF